PDTTEDDVRLAVVRGDDHSSPSSIFRPTCTAPEGEGEIPHPPSGPENRGCMAATSNTNRRTPSTTWEPRHVMVRRPPKATGDSARRAPLRGWRSLREARRPSPLVLTDRGGPGGRSGWTATSLFTMP